MKPSTRFALLLLGAVAATWIGAVWPIVPHTPRDQRAVVRRCASCHLPNGFGRPDSASLAGLPAAYIAQQMADYRRHVRTSPQPAPGGPPSMMTVAAETSDDDGRTASEYFASIEYTRWVRVVETASAPATPLAADMRRPIGYVAADPIGNRIIEVPADRRDIQARASAPGFVAYVPVGSIKAGETLVVTGGGGRTVRCALCHGDDLKGLGPVPGIAGRSPTYALRQILEMQRGVRHGLGSDLMRATVARLTEQDAVAIAAFVASQEP